MPPQKPALMGLIGGLSYHSSLIYYRLLNEKYAVRLGQDRSLPLLMYSHDFGIIGQAQEQGAWHEVKNHILDSAQILSKAGCQSLLIASNTIHKYASAIEKKCNIPVLHIGDAIRDQLDLANCQRVGLLGTRLTMEEPFLKRRILMSSQRELIVPELQQRLDLHELIWNKLVRGTISSSDKQWFQDFCNSWTTQCKLDALVLSCTELGLLEAKPEGFIIVDSLEAHVDYALKWHYENAP